jgi:Domain of unknown function (DUF222)/HNH endonuclease
MFKRSIQPASALIGDADLDFEGRERNQVIADLLQSKPGPQAMTSLLDINKSELSPADRVDFLKCWQKQSAWVAFQEQEAMLYVAGSEAQEKAGEMDVDQEGREDVSTALRLSPNTSQEKIDVARVISNNLPATASALNSGEIPPQTATVIAKETALALRAGLAPEAIREIEKVALAHAEFHTPGQVARKLRTTFATLAPELFQKEFEVQREARKVIFYKEESGVGTILATLKIEDAQLVDQVISDYSDKLLAEHREAMQKIVRFSRGHTCIKNCQTKYASNQATDALNRDSFHGYLCSHACSDICKDACLALNAADAAALAALERANFINSDIERDMRRADAFVFAMRAADAALKSSGTVVTRHNRRPTINVTIDLPTALGLANNPGQLAGYGPIPANIARQIAADGRWKRFVTDPISGVLLDYGRETYEPPQELQDYLIARDRTCRFPGCRQPAHLADLDHAIPWDKGGSTSAENLGALCRRHHNLKTHKGWRVQSNPDGSCTWTNPAGQTYFVPARPVMDAI